MSTHPTGKTSPLSELRASLSEFADRCKAQRWFGALFRVNVAQDIVADVANEHAAGGRDGYAAEQADILARDEVAAARVELETALADGLDKTDRPRVVAAIARLKSATRHVDNSAALDRRITERFATA
jgi:hypothetical protein